MRRRTLLASIGALSAGCLGSSRTNSTTTTEDGGTTPGTTTACDSGTKTAAAESAGETETDGQYRLTNLSKSTHADRPSTKYVLEPSSVYSGDAVEREEERTGEQRVVRDISEVSNEEVRDAIETAVRTGAWRSDSLPDGLAETVERVDFFTGVSDDDLGTHVGLTLHRLRPDRPPAIEFDATIVDAVVSEPSPGVVEFELTNNSSTTQEVFSGTVPPFGTVFADAAEGDDRFLLWRNYGEEGCIRFTDDGMIQCDIGKFTELRPCESVSRRYEVLPSTTDRYPEYTAPPGPGTYRVADSLSYSSGGGAPESELSFEVEFTLESPSE